MRLCHSPWEIVDPYYVLVNHNAGRHHPNENLCITLVLKERGTYYMRELHYKDGKKLLGERLHCWKQTCLVQAEELQPVLIP